MKKNLCKIIGRREAGQALMIAVLIGAVLFISLPAMLFFTQTGAGSQIERQKRTKARQIAEEGLSHAAQILSVNTVTWSNATVSNTFAGVPDCNTATPIKSPSGGYFKLTCTNADTTPDIPIQFPYQLNVISTAYLPDKSGTLRPYRSLQAYFSKRTLGADLTTGLHASAALELVKVPVLDGDLRVHWGPIVCLDKDEFPLTGPLDRVLLPMGVIRPGYPRKISHGAIVGTTPTRATADFPRAVSGTSSLTTDHREFWAFASQKFPPLINEGAYASAAKTNTGGTVPALAGAISLEGSRYYQGTANFEGNYTSADFPTNGVVYVEGDARFTDLTLNLNDAGLIVSKNLYLGSRSAGSGLAAGTAIRLPRTSSNEYDREYRTWPCYPGTAGTCVLPGGGTGPNFTGFLWVKGNLIVEQPGWILAGAVLVGDVKTSPPSGQLFVKPGTNLTIFYNDLVNHVIETAPVSGTSIEIQPEFIREISPR
jgi:hypothetical protein